MQKSKKKIIIDSFVIGAALFAMFFGAGNMIFPPYLGLKAGTQWFSGFMGYYIADIGLAVIAILAQIKTGGYKGIFSPLGNVARTAIMLSIVLCIGPLISIPRTAATTFELSINPLFDNVAMPIFCAVFFVVVLVMSINKSAVVDIIGKVLTPVLFLGLLFLILKGALDPVGALEALPRTQSPVADGIAAGYQSMDVLAAVIFGVLILNSAAQKGHTEPAAKARVAAGASAVAGFGLLVVYLGLTYLGATVSSLYDMHIYRTELLIALIQSILPGQAGMLFFAVVAGFACLSTAVALTGSAAEYISDLFKNKVSYRSVVVAICVFSGFAASLGVETLVKFASPVLSVVYPPVLVAIILSFFGNRIHRWGYRFAAVAATVTGIFDALASAGIRFEIVSSLPLNSLGLGWIVPSAFFCLAGMILGKLIDKKRKAND